VLGLLGLVSDRIFQVTTTRLLWRYDGASGGGSTQ